MREQTEPLAQTYTRKEAQMLLHISSDTMLNYIKQGYITPVSGKGRTMLFDYWDVTRLVGMKGKWLKNKKKLFDSRPSADTMKDITLE